MYARGSLTDVLLTKIYDRLTPANPLPYSLLRTLPTRVLSRAWGRLAETPIESEGMRSFTYGMYSKLFGVNVDEAREPLTSFPSLQAFFSRRIKPEVSSAFCGVICRWRLSVQPAAAPLCVVICRWRLSAQPAAAPLCESWAGITGRRTCAQLRTGGCKRLVADCQGNPRSSLLALLHLSRTLAPYCVYCVLWS